jgi:pimeloyl-ACP methyl ester carboxylesterase
VIFEVDNKKVFASDAGQGIDKNKATIVLLHGSGLSHIVWSLTEQYLSNQNNNVLAIDLPGHGNSQGKCLKSIEEISDWLEKVFDKLEIMELTIIGHSNACESRFNKSC